MTAPDLRWDQAEVVAWERPPPEAGEGAPDRFEVTVPSAGPGLGRLLMALSQTTGKHVGVIGLQCSTTVRADGSYLLRLIGHPDRAAHMPVTPDNVLAILQLEVEHHSED